MKDFLHDIVTEAGRMSLEYRRRLQSVRVDLKSRKDLVTEADVAIERFLLDAIRKRYPDHAVLGEETGRTGPETAEYRWVIDPIDGTTGFVHGHPFYSTSIAVQQAGRTILAAVEAPVLGETYEAQLGRGATCNGHPIRVSDTADLTDAVLGTGFACLRGDMAHNNLPYFTDLAPVIRGVRRFGSVAIDLPYVAMGRLDVFWELNLQIYDIAAGALILTEAGGRITDFQGGQDHLDYEILATNGPLHDPLLARIAPINRRLRAEHPDPAR